MAIEEPDVTTSGSIVVVLSRHKSPTTFPDTAGPVNAELRARHPEDTISLSCLNNYLLTLCRGVDDRIVDCSQMPSRS